MNLNASGLTPRAIDDLYAKSLRARIESGEVCDSDIWLDTKKPVPRSNARYYAKRKREDLCSDEGEHARLLIEMFDVRYSTGTSRFSVGSDAV
jgi:hypothetical protein